MAKIFLNIGCENRKFEGFINSDKDEMDISKPWPYQDNSVDGISAMQGLQQLQWRDLTFTLREIYRVLKPDGVLRFSTVLIEKHDLDYLLGWENINVFSFDLLKEVFKQIGFKKIRLAKPDDSVLLEFRIIDDYRVRKGSSYIEVIK